MEESGFSREVIEAKEHSGIDRVSTNTLRSRIDTKPLNGGGASFKTHELVKESNTKIRFRPTTWTIVFASIFLCVGLIVLAFSLFSFFKMTQEKSNDVVLFTLLFGSVFALAGGFLVYYFYKPIVFDKRLKIFYKSYKSSTNRMDIQNSKDHVFLNTIVAIQLLGETIQSDDRNYNSFELNLVLTDGTRKNVVDHGNLPTLIKDARILSEFLAVPIWHTGEH